MDSLTKRHIDIEVSTIIIQMHTFPSRTIRTFTKSIKISTIRPISTTSKMSSAQNERGQGVSHAQDSKLPQKAQEAVSPVVDIVRPP